MDGDVRERKTVERSVNTKKKDIGVKCAVNGVEVWQRGAVGKIGKLWYVNAQNVLDFISESVLRNRQMGKISVKKPLATRERGKSWVVFDLH